MPALRAAIVGLAGPELTAEERALFAGAPPAGFILFGRNCVDRAQLKALTAELRALTGRARLPVLIDQEGGRVARLAPPEWPAFPAPARFGEAYARAPITAIEAARANGAALAAVLREVGVSIDCLPLLDLVCPETHPAIGDRAFGADPLCVAALGRALLDGLESGGVLGIVKHLPGQGRAAADSHSEAPLVGADAAALERDLAPFRALAQAPLGMAGHVRYAAWDPDRPASVSPAVIREVIRGSIGFAGLLLSDDIAMGALEGTLAERTCAVLDAGCDIALHCSGVAAQSAEVLDAAGPLPQFAADRLDAALARVADRPPGDHDALAAQRDALFAASA